MKGYRKRERGQALIIVAFAIITLIAFVGLGVDLGLAYVERVRVQRAADAAALAAASELPLEAAAHLRALEYLAENDYDCTLEVAGGGANCTNPEVYVSVNGVENFPDDPANPVPTRIEINTDAVAQEEGVDTAVRIRVKVTQRVKLYFMKLLGFPYVPVSGVATAENIKDLDIVLVFDESGSMEFDTLCYGCWTPDDTVEYPEGDPHQLVWNGPPYGPPEHCQGNTIPTTKINNVYYPYIAIEAEDYSFLSNDYHRATSAGQGYTAWAMQRNGSVNYPKTGYLGDSGAWGRDVQGAYLMHIPFISYESSSGASGVACTWADLINGEMCRRNEWITNRGGPYEAPRADYDFIIPSTPTGSTWYFWVRVSGGDGGGEGTGQELFWGLGGTPRGEAAKGNATSWHYNGAAGWAWRRLGNVTLTPGNYTLNLWAGSPGYAVDRIVITTYSGSFPSTLNKADVLLDNNRTRWACDPCDARFGGHPEGLGNTSGDGDDPPRCDASVPGAEGLSDFYRYNDDLFDDEQPFASTAKSALRFIRRLDPEFDQIGLIRFSSTATPATVLLCLKSNGAGCTKNVINNTMYEELMDRNKANAEGGTNIPDGLEEAMKLLAGPHGRPGAAKIIILMTDGQPTDPRDSTGYNMLDNANKSCRYENLWTQDEGSYNPAYDCAIYMARAALNDGVVIYGITLGVGADQEFMDTVADMTGGVHLHAETPDRLDDIFDELWGRIFLRLVE